MARVVVNLSSFAVPSFHAFFPAAFVHVTFQHLLGNMLLLGVLGGILERRYGAVRSWSS